MLLKFGKILIIAGIVLAAGLLLRDGCKKFIPTEPKLDERLKDNERERIIVNDRGDVVHIKRGTKGTPKDQVAYRDTGAGETRVTIDDKGNILVTQTTNGFVFRPGLCFAFSQDEFLIGPDVQFYYIRNFGATLGLTTTPKKDFEKNIQAHIAASYRLPFESFRNTQIFVGYSTKREVIFGTRVRF